MIPILGTFIKTLKRRQKPSLFLIISILLLIIIYISNHPDVFDNLIPLVNKGSSSKDFKETNYDPSLKNKYISVMTYNVENLFDTKDDPRKKDDTFLPKMRKSKKILKSCKKISRKKWRDECLYLDWSEETLNQKMENLSKVVLSVDSGNGPDILILQEIENKSVLEEWNQNFLKKAGYKTIILIEGKDIRGIDVAILSRFKLNKRPNLYPIPLNHNKRSKTDSRGVLKASLIGPTGDIIEVLALHLPAPHHPTILREQSLKYLNKLLNEKSKSNNLIIAGGDFNVTSSEERKGKLFKKIISPKWWVSHFDACSKCKGSNYYPPKKSWSFLDALLVAKNQKSWKVNNSSVRVIDDFDFQVSSSGKPRAFDGKTKKGASDHLPIYMEIVKSI